MQRKWEHCEKVISGSEFDRKGLKSLLTEEKNWRDLFSRREDWRRRSLHFCNLLPIGGGGHGSVAEGG